jgi:hypothetical protein
MLCPILKGKDLPENVGIICTAKPECYPVGQYKLTTEEGWSVLLEMRVQQDEQALKLSVPAWVWEIIPQFKRQRTTSVEKSAFLSLQQVTDKEMIPFSEQSSLCVTVSVVQSDALLDVEGDRKGGLNSLIGLLSVTR